MPPNRRRSQRRASTGSAGTPRDGFYDLDPARRTPMGRPRLPWKRLVPLGVLLAAIGVAIIVNYIVTVKSVADEPILTVNSRDFAFREYVSMLKAEKLLSEAVGGQFDAGRSPYLLFQGMAQDELIRQAEGREGLRVTDEDVRTESLTRLGFPDGVKYDDVAADFQVRLSNYLSTSQLTAGQYEEKVRTALLREQLQEKLGTDIPRVQPQARLLMIRIPDTGPSDAVAKRLAEGEDFGTVAREVSVDEESRNHNGERGWTPRLVFKEFDTLLFGLNIGQVSDPIPAPEGVYVIRLLERIDGKARLQAALVQDTAAARALLQRSQNGENFADLSAELSTDAELQAKRGDFGLVGVGEYEGLFDFWIRGIAAGQATDPLTSLEGTYFFKVVERSQAVEVSEDDLKVLQSRTLEAWLDLEQATNSVIYHGFGSVKVSRALDQVEDIASTKFQREITATAQAAGQNQNPGLFQ